MTKIDFSELKLMAESLPVFTLTDKEYLNITGRKLPIDKFYTVNKSSLSRFAKENNLKISVGKKSVRFEKIK